MTDETVKVTFQGASDDCIEIGGCPGADEFYVDAEGAGVFELVSGEDRLLVRVAYERTGTWSVGFMPVDEGVAMPAWPIRFGDPMNDYTACVVMDCPPDVTLTRREVT